MKNFNPKIIFQKYVIPKTKNLLKKIYSSLKLHRNRTSVKHVERFYEKNYFSIVFI